MSPRMICLKPERILTPSCSGSGKSTTFKWRGFPRVPCTLHSHFASNLHRCRPLQVSASSTAAKSLTQQIFEQIDALQSQQQQAGGAGGRTTYAALKSTDDAWYKLRNMREGVAAGPAPTFVKTGSKPLAAVPEHDVVVCGGTLGIFVAAALAQRGLRVAVIERGVLQGRAQEWNISRKEMEELVKVGLLTEQELDECINITFNPVRVGFKGGKDVWTRDVLNLGASPVKLVAKMMSKLEAAGGKVLEKVNLQGVAVAPNGCSLRLAPITGGDAAGADQQQPTQLTARLVLDCMGHASPIVRQLRWGKKPDGVCLVVGALGSGFTNNNTADVIYTHTDLQPQDAPVSRLQYFWEAFPASSGPTDRTTYMFTYIDAQAWRPSLEALLEDYWRLMPRYQGVDLDDITFKRVLFGFFPTFRDSPLQPGFDRVLQIGDASGIQSPLSFGGFGALTRHLSRLVTAIEEALEVDALDRASLALLNAYSPGLSSAWMLQRAMSVREQPPPPDLINKMLSGNFWAQEGLGEAVMKPFLQDVLKFGPLMQTMAQQMIQEPGIIPSLLMHVGPLPLLDWTRHVAALGAYTATYQLLGPGLRQAAKSLPPKQRFAVNRAVDALEFGSGSDYKL